MTIVNTYEAKTKLSQLLKRAQQGEEIVIAQSGVPIARLVPIVASQGNSRLGIDRGAFEVPDDFNDSILDEDLK
jgi:prevent-host-death family protein